MPAHFACSVGFPQRTQHRYDSSREIHRRDVVVLRARLGLREWWERIGTTQNVQSLAIEQAVTRRFRYLARDPRTFAVQREAHQYGTRGAARGRRITLELLEVPEHEGVIGIRTG